jgi:hypothetical protein
MVMAGLVPAIHVFTWHAAKGGHPVVIDLELFAYMGIYWIARSSRAVTIAETETCLFLP